MQEEPPADPFADETRQDPQVIQPEFAACLLQGIPGGECASSLSKPGFIRRYVTGRDRQLRKPGLNRVFGIIRKPFGSHGNFSQGTGLFGVGRQDVYLHSAVVPQTSVCAPAGEINPAVLGNIFAIDAVFIPHTVTNCAFLEGGKRNL